MRVPDEPGLPSEPKAGLHCTASSTGKGWGGQREGPGPGFQGHRQANQTHCRTARRPPPTAHRVLARDCAAGKFPDETSLGHKSGDRAGTGAPRSPAGAARAQPGLSFGADSGRRDTQRGLGGSLGPGTALCPGPRLCAGRAEPLSGAHRAHRPLCRSPALHFQVGCWGPDSPAAGQHRGQGSPRAHTSWLSRDSELGPRGSQPISCSFQVLPILKNWSPRVSYFRALEEQDVIHPSDRRVTPAWGQLQPGCDDSGLQGPPRHCACWGNPVP